jgi:nucleotide-binding universal stress UspA family protein
VLVGLDDAPSNRDVLAWAVLFACRLDARLKMLHVLTNRAYSFAASLAAAHAHGDLEREEAELREELYGHCHRWLAHCAAAGGDPARVDIDVDWGAASERILAHARHDGVQLIVLGRHRAAGGLRGLLGGTAMRVLHAARCGVAVIPPPMVSF